MTAQASLAKVPIHEGKPVQGIYYGLSEFEYDMIPAHRSTILRRLISATPHHARHQMTNGAARTKPKERGQLLHMALLEPARFAAQHLVIPSAERLTFGAHMDFRTNRAKELKQQWLEAHPLPQGVTEYLAAEEVDAISGMARALWGNALAARMLGGKHTQREVTIVWLDTVGIWCKARLDLLFPWERWTAIGDVKSCRSAAKFAFGRAAAQYGYHIQGAFYLRGLAHVRGEQKRAKPIHRPFFFICVENVDPDPRTVAIFEMEKQELEIANAALEQGLHAIAECERTGDWVGYPEEIQKLALPSWMYHEDRTEADELAAEIAALEELD